MPETWVLGRFYTCASDPRVMDWTRAFGRVSCGDKLGVQVANQRHEFNSAMYYRTGLVGSLDERCSRSARQTTQ